MTKTTSVNCGLYLQYGQTYITGIHIYNCRYLYTRSIVSFISKNKNSDGNNAAMKSNCYVSKQQIHVYK